MTDPWAGYDAWLEEPIQRHYRYSDRKQAMAEELIGNPDWEPCHLPECKDDDPCDVCVEEWLALEVMMEQEMGESLSEWWADHMIDDDEPDW